MGKATSTEKSGGTTRPMEPGSRAFCVLCGVLSAPCGRAAALHAAPHRSAHPQGPHTPAPPWGCCHTPAPCSTRLGIPGDALTHVSGQGGCPRTCEDAELPARHRCEARGAHTRVRLGMLNSPQGYSQAKITHHRLHAVFCLLQPFAPQ